MGKKQGKKREPIKKIIAKILAAVGITIGGVALLNSGKGNDTKPIEQTERDNDEQGNTNSKTDREIYLDELREGIKDYSNQSEEQQNTDTVIDEIIETYNNNLLEQAEIDKEDVGIILQSHLGNGHIIQTTSENGDISYIENALKDELAEGQEWISGEDTKDIYILVDTKHNNTMAGIGKIDDEISEIDVEFVRLDEDYTKNDETYVGLPENVDMDKAYQDFSRYYQERIQQQEENQKKEIEDDGLEF